jgi:transcriptional regulator with XRE-family HTH domain
MSPAPISTAMDIRNGKIGSILLEYRVLRGKTQKECARRIECSISHYDHLEAGTSKIWAIYLEALVEFLDIPLDALWPNIALGKSTRVTVEEVQDGRLSITVRVEAVVDMPESKSE